MGASIPEYESLAREIKRASNARLLFERSGKLETFIVIVTRSRSRISANFCFKLVWDMVVSEQRRMRKSFSGFPVQGNLYLVKKSAEKRL